MDIIYQYPPELMSLLIDAVPKLCRSKMDLLAFFRGAGVGQALLEGYEKLLQTDKERFNKYQVTREVLKELNERGESSLRERREILKRVNQFDDFSVCWERDQLAARGLVAQIRELTNIKDSFTRMNLEREQERSLRLAEREDQLKADRLKKETLQRVKTELSALFVPQDAHKRGKALERILTELFSAYGVLVREPFTVKGRCGEGVIEQIDGLIELEGNLYLVELKWWSSPLGSAEISPHLVRLYGRGGTARGLFISYSEYTDSALAVCRDALAGRMVVVLATLREIVELLDREAELKDWVKKNALAAIAHKNPLHLCLRR